MDLMTIGDEDAVLGFQLAGVPGIVFTEDTIKESLKTASQAKILILTEAVASYLRDNDLTPKGIVIAEIPSKDGSSGAAMKNISRLLEEAIGVQLKG